MGADRDLAVLSRATRSAGQEFGLDDGRVRSLCAAADEIARLLLGLREADADLRLAPGPALQVRFRVAEADGAARAALAARLSEAIAHVRGMVDMVGAVAIDEQHGELIVCLTACLPAEAAERLQACATPPNTGRHRPTQTAAALPRPRYDDLVRAVEELQAELQETNRGVVALHAELESNADSLRQAEDRLRLLLDSVQDYAICMLTPDGEVASWNAGAERLFARPAEHIIGRHFGLFYTGAGRKLSREHLWEAAATGRLACEGLLLRRGDDEEFVAHVVITPVRREREGELRGFSLVVRDITERRRLEDDLHQRAEELAAANRAKEAFLATLSHELRTPLNAMLGWTRLLRLGKLDAAGTTRALDTIERNAHVQEQLIADILDVSRIVTGKLRLDLHPLSLGPVAAAALDAVRPAAEAKRIAIDVRNDSEVTVLGDADRLQQVLWNLLVNAVKFTPEGGRVAVSLAAEGPHAVISVTDTGEGILPDLLPRVFDRFTQGDASVTRRHGGLGLGLSIVRHLVEIHGGEVHAESEGEGRGAMFSVRLPLRAAWPAVAEPAPQPGQLLSGVKVLVVDDEAEVRQIVSLALSQCGARTAAVSSAREAFRMMAEFLPDVVVSDIGMPGEDGCTFIRRLRATGATGIGDVPAVALTAYCQPEDRTRALSAGFQQFVPKPVGMDELAAIVRTLAHSRSH